MSDKKVWHRTNPDWKQFIGSELIKHGADHPEAKCCTEDDVLKLVIDSGHLDVGESALPLEVQKQPKAEIERCAAKEVLRYWERNFTLTYSSAATYEAISSGKATADWWSISELSYKMGEFQAAAPARAH